MADGTGPSDSSDLHVRQLTLRAVRLDSREVDFVASTDAIDSYGEIVAQNWDLKRFLANPVCLWSHQSYELPIGQAVRCEVVKGQLECTIRFASERANPRAEQVWQSVVEKTLRAVSVGFYPREIRFERHDDVDVCVLDDNELREISVVSIPANPEALAKAKTKALADYQAKQAKQDAPPAERGGSSTKEHDMDKDQKIAALEAELASLKTKNAEAEADKAKLVAELVTVKSAQPILLERDIETETKLKALESQVANLVADRDAKDAAAKAAEVARKAAEDALIDAEVSALVGKKITAAEKPEQVKLRKLDKALFDALIAQRSDLNLEKQIIPTEEKAGDIVAAPGALGSEEAEAKAFAAYKKSNKD